MSHADYREMLVAIAGAAGALTGLLFVALSVAPRPGPGPGYPSVALGVIGLFFTAASIRSVAASGATAGQLRAQLGLIMLLVLIFGTELVAGIAGIAAPASSNAPGIIGYALVASVLVGIGRAWELVGNVDTEPRAD